MFTALIKYPNNEQKQIEVFLKVLILSANNITEEHKPRFTANIEQMPIVWKVCFVNFDSTLFM